MYVQLSEFLKIECNDDNLEEWSFDKNLFIYTFKFKDGTVWNYEPKTHKFYMV